MQLDSYKQSLKTLPNLAIKLCFCKVFVVISIKYDKSKGTRSKTSTFYFFAKCSYDKLYSYSETDTWSAAGTVLSRVKI